MSIIANEMAYAINFLSKVSRMSKARVLNCNRNALSNLSDRTSLYLAMDARRTFSKVAITQNVKLNTLTPVSLEKKDSRLPVLASTEPRPLVLLLEYLNAQEKHIQKIVDLYINYGFDVLQVNITSWQLLWPTKGSQIVAKDVAEYLAANKIHSPMVVHGFSVGAYLWGEVLVYFSKNLKIYQPVADRIKYKIFDSPVDLDELPNAFPRALFPNNAFLKNVFEKYLRFHLSKFYEESTKHYQASRKEFSRDIVKCPTLVLTSDSDAFSSLNVSDKLRQEFSAVNLEYSVKVFKESPHVMHFKNYPQEYSAEIERVLTKSGILPIKNIKAKL